MMTDDMTLMGWFHTLWCFVAMFAGAWNLARVKGTAIHAKMGQLYVASMVLQNASALFVFEPHRHAAGQLALDHFGLFHWLALATLAIVGIAYFSARRQNRLPYAYLHPAGMILSYYLLVGGAVNEVFVRINVLRPIGFVVGPDGKGAPSAAVGLTHFTIMVAAFVILTYFVMKVAMYRRRREPAHLAAAE